MEDGCEQETNDTAAGDNNLRRVCVCVSQSGDGDVSPTRNKSPLVFT